MSRNLRSQARSGSAVPQQIPLGMSTAYGSPGRPVVPPTNGLLTNMTAAEALRQAERSSPKKKAAREEEESLAESEEADPEPPVRSQRRRGASARPASSLLQDGTSIGPTGLYEPRPAPTPRRRPNNHSPPRPERRSVQSDGFREAAEPRDSTVLVHSIPRYVRDAFSHASHFSWLKWLTILLSLLLVSTLIGLYTLPLPRNLIRTRARVERGLRLIVGMEEYERVPTQYEQSWQYFKYEYILNKDELPDWNMPELQWIYNLQFLNRIEQLEARTDALETSVTSLQNIMRSELPMRTVVENREGEWLVPQGFWLALHGKLTGDSTLWQAFLNANDANLKERTGQAVSEQLALGREQSSVISRDQLEDIIRQNYDDFLKDFRSNMNLERGDLVTEVRKIASQVAADLIARETSGHISLQQQAQNRAGVSFLSNNLDELHSVNYFSPYHGAEVDYRFTSPTAIREQPNVLAQLVANFGPQPNKPHTALRAWKEVTESWCAAKSTSPGKAQIGIDIQHAIVPSELIVEHIPRGGTLEIANAPRELEMWMDIGQNLANAEQTIAQEVPSWQRLECDHSPGPGYICIARGSYDIHDDNWVQSIPVARFFSDYKMKSQKFIVRAVANWGGDHTCFYRLRLKGEA